MARYKKISRFVNKTITEVLKAPESAYRTGYLDALYNVKDEIETIEWEEGEDG